MNYSNTIIVISPDCPAEKGLSPPQRGDKKSVALLQFEMLSAHPYQYTQEDVLWQVHLRHKQVKKIEATVKHRKLFFSKPQAGLRSSQLAKRYGWGFHFDADGKVALYGMESKEYRAFAKANPQETKKLTAMRNSRK